MALRMAEVIKRLSRQTLLLNCSIRRVWCSSSPVGFKFEVCLELLGRKWLEDYRFVADRVDRFD